MNIIILLMQVLILIIVAANMWQAHKIKHSIKILKTRLNALDGGVNDNRSREI